MMIGPCPFCGHEEVKAIPDPQNPEGAARGMFQVLCYTCGAMGPTRNGEESAIAGWNKVAQKTYSVPEGGNIYGQGLVDR